ncbi:hypothetical protein PP938_gp019 [Rhizobium phage AF3]|uniref:Uncharacterized protein n=1 Tax=Rhizobium phage AF3 TaxID=2763529 RepID=A0A7G7WWL7_9CAUD|nr:hypothetical protein PP938_gp019 [Rhizobium phage AF3]QNH71611.1 hypothetical protein AF3_019 [Rhizobium phage AF3]
MKNQGSAFYKFKGYVDEILDPGSGFTFRILVKLDDWHTPLSFGEDELEKYDDD